jgi:hypothetical protein
VPAAFFDQPFHNKPGKSLVPVFFKNINAVNFVTVRLPGTAGYTNELRPGKRSEQPVSFDICFLQFIVDPELLFGTAHFMGRELPDFNVL